MPSHTIGRSIAVLSRYYQMAMSKRLESLGIGPGQYPFILNVQQQPGIVQDRLADQLYLNKSTITRAVTQLEQAGYLRREPDPYDKRAMRLYITEKTERTMPQIHAMLQEVNEELAANLNPDELEAAERLLQRMCEGLERRK